MEYSETLEIILYEEQQKYENIIRHYKEGTNPQDKTLYDSHGSSTISNCGCALTLTTWFWEMYFIPKVVNKTHMSLWSTLKLANILPKSYLLDVFIPLKTLFKYEDLCIDWIRKYSKWMDYSFEVMPINSTVLYNDIRRKTYAVLKTSNFNPQNLIDYLGNLQYLLQAQTSLLLVIPSVLGKIDKDQFQQILDIILKTQSINFKPIYEVFHDSIVNTTLFNSVVKTISEINVIYVDHMVDDFIDCVKCVPTLKEQKIFIKEFQTVQV